MADKFSARLTVDMEAGWHIAAITTPAGGPVPTNIVLAKGQPFALVGPIKAPKPKREYSDAFGVDVETYEGEATFTIPLEATTVIPAGTKLAIEITYQLCSFQECQFPTMKTVYTEVK